MDTAKLFMNGRSQAVRIPKQFAFEGVSEVVIRREGDRLILEPARKSWLSLAEIEGDESFQPDRTPFIEQDRVRL